MSERMSDERLEWALHSRDAIGSHPYSVLYEFAQGIAAERAYANEQDALIERMVEAGNALAATLSLSATRRATAAIAWREALPQSQKRRRSERRAFRTDPSPSPTPTSSERP